MYTECSAERTNFHGLEGGGWWGGGWGRISSDASIGLLADQEDPSGAGEAADGGPGRPFYRIRLMPMNHEEMVFPEVVRNNPRTDAMLPEEKG